MFVEREPVPRADGRQAGRAFSPVGVIDLSRPGELGRLRAELAELGGPGPPGAARRPVMSGPNGQLTPGPGAKIIPLMPGVARPSGGRREELRTAVLQVVSHLVIEKVPADQRSPLFDQATELLNRPGWGLDELYAAAADGPERSALFRAQRRAIVAPAIAAGRPDRSSRSSCSRSARYDWEWNTLLAPAVLLSEVKVIIDKSNLLSITRTRQNCRHG